MTDRGSIPTPHSAVNGYDGSTWLTVSEGDIGGTVRWDSEVEERVPGARLRPALV